MSAAVRLRPLPLLCAALALTGCAATKTTVLRRHELRLREDEYRILPRSVSVPAGRLKIVVANNGVLAHNLVIERGGEVLAAVPTILPGQTGGPVKVTLAAGTYTLASTLASQSNLGMEATLRVRSP
jgi:hypothetical protein